METVKVIICRKLKKVLIPGERASGHPNHLNISKFYIAFYPFILTGSTVECIKPHPTETVFRSEPRSEKANTNKIIQSSPEQFFHFIFDERSKIILVYSIQQGLFAYFRLHYLVSRKNHPDIAQFYLKGRS